METNQKNRYRFKKQLDEPKFNLTILFRLSSLPLQDSNNQKPEQFFQ
jgi:hypothetical protein